MIPFRPRLPLVLCVGAFACGPGPASTELTWSDISPTPPFVVPQLQSDFVDTLEVGFACELGGFGLGEGHAALLNAENTVRIQLSNGDPARLGIVVFVGEDLDAVFGDDDACDDVVSGGRRQHIGMAWSATAGSYTTTEALEGRTYHLEDIVLDPDPVYAEFNDDYANVDDYDPLILGDVEIGAVAVGGVLRPLRGRQ